MSNKPFDFGADANCNPDAGILTEFLPLLDGANCQNSAGSAALAEVCGLRELLPSVVKIIKIFFD